MKESEFKALISLLEDDDPEVSAHVEGRLKEMGGEMIPRLEHAWETERDEIIQHRLEDIIQGIQERDALEKIVAWRKGEEKNLLEGWFLLSKYLYPNIRFSTYRNKINRLVNRIWMEFRRDMTGTEKLMVVNSMLFRVEKFKAGGRQMRTAGEFLINLLFEKRRGGPFSLGILYKILCDQLEIPLEVVILPGYMVLRSENEGSEFFIDTFQKGDFFLREDIAHYLREMRGSQKEVKIIRTTDSETILKEFIKGLIRVFDHQKDLDRVEALKSLQDLF